VGVLLARDDEVWPLNIADHGVDNFLADRSIGRLRELIKICHKTPLRSPVIAVSSRYLNELLKDDDLSPESRTEIQRYFDHFCIGKKKQ
jgi:hypothetical protein